MKTIQYWVYRILRFCFLRLNPKFEVVGLEHLPKEPCLVISNHCKLNGPIAGTFYFPGEHYLWFTGEMLDIKAVPEYAFQDFWSHKPRWSHWFYRILSHVIAPFCVCLFANGPGIPVYRDQRVMNTFRETVKRLKEGANVIIFPEHDAPYDDIHADFQVGFVDVARIYYKQTGKRLSFVPMYVAPSLHQIHLGEPIAYCPENSAKEERSRICGYLMEQISATARALPRHKVVPYQNRPRKDYTFNREE